MNGWLNFYKPVGISSAKLVAIIKKALGNKIKVGHAGTLDVEAKGVLPLAIGEAIKLVSYLMEARKEYEFTVQFGAQTNTGDASGVITRTTEHSPTRQECFDVCAKFIGLVTQVPPAFSALKINGQRSYSLARKQTGADLTNHNKARQIQVFDLKLLSVDEAQNRATYSVVCAKGTYVRTLAEDIALSLQSLGFVVRLQRTKVGKFCLQSAIYLPDFERKEEISKKFLENNIIEAETILDDIPVLDVTETQAKKVKFGQQVLFEDIVNQKQIWLRYEQRLLAIGCISEYCFRSQRVFNLDKYKEKIDVDYSRNETTSNKRICR